MRFCKASPIGDERADIYSANLLAMYANAHRDAEKQKAPYTASDFLLFDREPERALKEGEVWVTVGFSDFMKE